MATVLHWFHFYAAVLNGNEKESPTFERFFSLASLRKQQMSSSEHTHTSAVFISKISEPINENVAKKRRRQLRFCPVKEG